MTGSAPSVEKVKLAREKANPKRPILMGSGTNADNVADFLQYADGCIVGFSIKEDPRPENAVSVEKVKRYMSAVESVRKTLKEKS
jgi:predicted TIM-barrel enzyme